MISLRRLGLGCLLALLLASCKQSTPSASPAASSIVSPTSSIPPPSPKERYAGSIRCAKCHAAEFQRWEGSHHAMAEHAVSNEVLQKAFAPGEAFQHATQETTPRIVDGEPVLIADGLGGSKETHKVSHGIGVEPLLQFLVHGSGGRLQATEACWDVRTNEWFNVYGNEDRMPGEWGHWTGRGMTWNSMCAYCHNTALQKGYDAERDEYHTTMVERGVGCEACHGPMKDHSEWQEKNPGAKGDPTLKPVSHEKRMDSCASCHSRRGELDGNFLPGDHFLDHFNPALVDATHLWYPDGQNQDEDFEWAAFSGSRMHAAGITCVNCHDYHSGKTIAQGNTLCMICHQTGAFQAPVIDATRHSFHPPGSTGDTCVHCHMPQTAYMQRHLRHDHGFTSPDPLMTMEFGIPNACNRCHKDQTPQWALQYADKWYGERMETLPRKRTRAIAAARRGDPAARDGLIAVLQSTTETPYWKAVAAGLLEPWAHEPGAWAALSQSLNSSNALVRARSMFAITNLVEGGYPKATQLAQKMLDDPIRLVRYHAAWSLRDTLPTDHPAIRELQQTLAHNADQPTGQVQLGLAELARGNTAKALQHYGRAVAWDARAPGLRHDYAVMLSMLDRNAEARQQMETAVALEPTSAEYRFKLALSSAEAGDTPAAITQLEQALKLDPTHARAWYNLGLAYAQIGKLDPGIQALLRAEDLSPNDPAPCYARATLHARLGQNAEAKAAAQKALQRAPTDQRALQLFRSIP